MRRNYPLTTAGILTALLVAGLIFQGCSLIDPPEVTDGNISLSFVRSEASNYAASGDKGLEALALALPIADSIRVNVYPPGNGGVPEVGMGVAIPPATDTITVDLTVIAENNKRVAVELYVGGSLVFFGVNEDVDVVANQNTAVEIRASQFVMNAISVSPVRIWDGESFTMWWPSVPGATTYHIQESSVPDFSVINWQTFVVDTFVSGPLPGGDYYFRVAARNTYTKSAWSATQIHIGGAPQVAGISPQEVLRNDVVDFTVSGIDLDHPSTQVSVFGQACTILGPPSPTQLTARVGVPSRAFSGYVTVTNQFGSDDSSQKMKVYTIAYIMGPSGSGGAVSAAVYKGMIDSYGGQIQDSAVYILPYDLINFSPFNFDLKRFDVIIVGWDTGTTASDWGGGSFGGPQRADAIRDAGASILGMGTGGAAYFELAGLEIGIDNGVPDFGRDMWVVERTATIYSQPNPITIPGTGILKLYEDTAPIPYRLGVDAPSNSVSLYASVDQSSKVYPLVDEPVAVSGPSTLNNFLWGFHGSPTGLTADGSDIFENVVKFVFDDGTKDVLQQIP